MLSFFKKLFGDVTIASLPATDEVPHINQEMYKKSVELSERNKTLLLLRKIDEIILSSVTNKKEIANQVTQLLISETDFKLISIYLYSKTAGELQRFSFATAHQDINVQSSKYDSAISKETISIADSNNLIAQAVVDKMTKSTNTLTYTILIDESEDRVKEIEQSLSIKSAIAYPMIVRNQQMGVMVIALADLEQDISQYTKDLLERLSQVIGIAIDNASLYTELQDANEKLKTLDKLKDEFVYLASHELRTPMTAIKSYLWMTLQGDAGPLNDTQKLYLERSYSSVERLIKLVNDMLNISRIESGRVTVALQKSDIVGLVKEVIEDVGPRASEAGVSVSLVPPPPLPAVLADADKIKEVLFNLIGNALKFTPKGGSVTVSFAENNGFVETNIRDTGAGISVENISKLFQKFSMLPESYSVNKNASGTGLGLYISRCIIELHQGKIWVTSEGHGKGSQFSFSLKTYKENDLKITNSVNSNIVKEELGIIHTQL
jgi:signal transduction histidine kinase